MAIEPALVEPDTSTAGYFPDGIHNWTDWQMLRDESETDVTYPARSH